VPLYRSMIESFSDGQGGYSPGVVWLYDPRSSEIRIAWRMGFDDRGQFARSRVASALADGWHGADIWAYYATAQSYNGYFTLRSMPETLVAPDMDTAAQAMLKRISSESGARL
jgi:hypothetical protein